MNQPKCDLFTTINQLDSCPLVVSGVGVCAECELRKSKCDTVMITRSICSAVPPAGYCDQTVMISLCLRISHPRNNLHNSQGRFSSEGNDSKRFLTILRFFDFIYFSIDFLSILTIILKLMGCGIPKALKHWITCSWSMCAYVHRAHMCANGKSHTFKFELNY